MIKSINLNNEVEVVLTKYGKEILDNYRTSMEKGIHQKLTSSFLCYEESGLYKTQMWNLMEVFGRHMYSGIQIFELNKIISRKT